MLSSSWVCGQHKNCKVGFNAPFYTLDMMASSNFLSSQNTWHTRQRKMLYLNGSSWQVWLHNIHPLLNVSFIDVSRCDVSFAPCRTICTLFCPPLTSAILHHWLLRYWGFGLDNGLPNLCLMKGIVQAILPYILHHPLALVRHR